MPFGVSDLIIAGSVVTCLVALGWIIARILDRRSDVLHYINREHREP